MANPHRRSKYLDEDGVYRYPNGREVCSDTVAGKREYKRRLYEMWIRQKGICAGPCGRFYDLDLMTFEHERPRKFGGSERDDRIIDEHGKPFNAATCLRCNKARGSRRTALNHFPAGDTEDEWPGDGGDF